MAIINTVDAAKRNAILCSDSRPPIIGFYVHYHGLGHKHRTEAILRNLSLPAFVVTSRIDTLSWQGPTLQKVVGIECDIEDVSEAGLLNANDVPALHYAPLWTDTITSRVAQYTAWLDTTKPDVMVVDVSAEVSMLTRLASIPQVVMRQHGDRRDPAHESAYAAAESLLAPFPKSMEDEITPDWVRSKTIYLDGFCRSPNRGNSKEYVGGRKGTQCGAPTIVVMFGRGGTGDVHARLREAAVSLPSYQWKVLGKEDDQKGRGPENLSFLGWIDAPQEYLETADLVITSAGHNSVMELGAMRKRFIAIAEQRPFAEQERKTIILEREGLAIGLASWPETTHWSDLIRRAERLDPSRWDRVFREDGARQAAEHLESLARWSRAQRATSGASVSCR